MAGGDHDDDDDGKRRTMRAGRWRTATLTQSAEGLEQTECMPFSSDTHAHTNGKECAAGADAWGKGRDDFLVKKGESKAERKGSCPESATSNSRTDCRVCDLGNLLSLGLSHTHTTLSLSLSHSLSHSPFSFPRSQPSLTLLAHTTHSHSRSHMHIHTRTQDKSKERSKKKREADSRLQQQQQRQSQAVLPAKPVLLSVMCPNLADARSDTHSDDSLVHAADAAADAAAGDAG